MLQFHLNSGRMGADFLDDAWHKSFVLFHQTQEDMNGFYGGVMVFPRDALRLENGSLCFIGIAAEVHNPSRCCGLYATSIVYGRWNGVSGT